MKFTEGYWVRSERANGLYAASVPSVVAIEGGMRLLTACGNVQNRAETLNMPVIMIEFKSSGKNMISVRAWHYEAYNAKAARFELTPHPEETQVEISETEAVMTTGELIVRVNRQGFSYQFEAGGKVLTTCGFRNLGYIRQNRQVSTLFPEANYLSSDYQPMMVTELSLAAGECVYGLGERFTAFVKNGQVVETWNEDGGTSSQIAYKSIPFYTTSRGYGIFVDHTENTSFEVASEKVEYVGFSVPGEELRYHFIYGPHPKTIMQSYTGLTGKPALPPAWSFGLWLSTSFTTDYDEKTVSHFINGMIDRDIPLSVFHFDCFWMKEFHWCDFLWDERVFPDVRGMLVKYKQLGLRITVWINPYIAQGTALFKDAVENGYLLRRQDGKGTWQTDFWQAGMGIVDFTNPAAARWYTDQLKNVLDMGVDAFKTDFGERIPVDVTYWDGTDPHSMHNFYTYIYNKTVFEFLQQEKGQHEAVLFARSATAGCQKFPVHWGGDCMASYASMAETLRGGLSLATSGFSFWSHDISGFEHTAPPDLYKRWLQFGMFSSHSRLHGSTSYRVPWLFDEESVDVLRYFAKLKNQLMPYLYSMAVNAHEQGIPLMRPMFFDFPEDPAVRYLDMQYLFGDSILVAPIFNDYGAVDYYLPEGEWTHLISGDGKAGGRWYRETFDYFSLPVYVRENTILPFGQVHDQPVYDYVKQIDLRLFKISQETSIKLFDAEGQFAGMITANRDGNSILIQTTGSVKIGKVILENMPGYTSVVTPTI